MKTAILTGTLHQACTKNAHSHFQFLWWAISRIVFRVLSFDPHAKCFGSAIGDVTELPTCVVPMSIAYMLVLCYVLLWRSPFWLLALFYLSGCEDWTVSDGFRGKVRLNKSQLHEA